MESECLVMREERERLVRERRDCYAVSVMAGI